MADCRDCPNKTDGKCCHETIRNNDRAWHREFEHAQRMQQARKEKHQPLFGVLTIEKGEC